MHGFIYQHSLYCVISSLIWSNITNFTKIRTLKLSLSLGYSSRYVYSYALLFNRCFDGIHRVTLLMNQRTKFLVDCVQAHNIFLQIRGLCALGFQRLQIDLLKEFRNSAAAPASGSTGRSLSFPNRTRCWSWLWSLCWRIVGLGQMFRVTWASPAARYFSSNSPSSSAPSGMCWGRPWTHPPTDSAAFSGAILRSSLGRWAGYSCRW